MRSLKRNLVVYSALTLFMVIFSFVYHIFSHGVTSIDMQLSFIWFLGSAIVYGLLLLINSKLKRKINTRLFMNLFNTASAAQVLGSVLKGVINIAGGSSAYLPVYFWIAQIAYGLSFLAFIVMFIPHRSKKA
ncbi:MAG: hypothetical protein HGB31_01520 [Erysipelotrichaceae bacterium]|nr:hypothetical protein [Erysipelotrichaceae bacterium]